MSTLRSAFPILVDYVAVGGLESSAYADWELSELLHSGAWNAVVGELADAAVGQPLDEFTLGALLPGLRAWREATLHDPAVVRAIPRLSVRAENCLSRANIRSWEDLSRQRVRDLGSLRNFGDMSKREVVRAAIQLAASPPGIDASPKSVDAADEQQSRQTTMFRELLAVRPRRIDSSAGHDVESQLPSETLGENGRYRGREDVWTPLASLMSWAASREPDVAVGDVLVLKNPAEELPGDLLSEWLALSAMRASELADPVLVRPDINALVDELLGAFGPVQRLVLEQRILSLTGPTLEQLGGVIGVTRQRVSQIQLRVEKRLDDILTLPRFRPLVWRAAEVRNALGTMALADHPHTAAVLSFACRGATDARLAVAQPLILRLAGPFLEDDGWLVRSGAPDVSAGALRERCDSNGLLRFVDAQSWLDERGVVHQFHEDWLKQLALFRRFGDVLALWGGSVVDKCVSLLALQGEPATAESLVATVGEGHNLNSVRQRFFEDPRVIRVNRSQWALAEWGLEEYSGIVEEIAQRIDQHGGQAKLRDLIADVSRTFGVREASVRLYATAPMFVTDNGWVRLRRPDEPFQVSGTLSEYEGVYHPSPSRVSIVLRVDKETLRGSGRAIAPAVGAALGVLPGLSKVFEGNGRRVRVTWPMSSAMGATLGSVRELAQDVECADGDRVRVDFDLELSTVAPTRIPATFETAGDQLHRLQLLTGIDVSGRNPKEAVAHAVGVSSDRVLGVLRSRGDADVAELLPGPDVDPNLQDALEDLAASISDAGHFE